MMTDMQNAHWIHELQIFNEQSWVGFLIQIKGRINGSDRSRRLKYRYGSLPLHTIDAPID